MNAYRIVLADDHVIFRQGIKRLIDEASGLEVVGEAGDGQELLQIMADRQPNLVLLDISMPNLGGFEALAEIVQRFPEVDILILTMHKNRQYLYHALASGARGYLLKEDSDIELFEAIENLRQNKRYVTRLLAGDIAGELCSALEEGGKVTLNLLTRREREVLKFIAGGQTNKEIADILSISVRTVENHRANMIKKLKSNKTAELVKYAIQHGIADIVP